MTTPLDTLDPRERPLFNPGMVLGAEDLQQEWTWLDGRDRWLAREAIGYGTLRGLKVELLRPSRDEDEAHGGGSGVNEIRVGPGVALDPAGRLVCVPETQHVVLEDWLTAAATRPDEVYVVLRHAGLTCEGVPARGGACCGDATVPVRMKDSFSLELSLDRPAHPETLALTTWRRLLASVRGADEGAGLRKADWRGAISDAFAELLRGDESPPLAVETSQLPAFLALAERLFVTELWPGAAGDGAKGAQAGALESVGLLLATLRLSWGESRTATIPGRVWLFEDDRPILAPAGLALGGTVSAVTEEADPREENAEDGGGSSNGGGVTAELKAILDGLITTRQAELDLLERRIEGLAADLASLRRSTVVEADSGDGTGDGLPAYEPLDDQALASRIDTAVNDAKRELYTGLRGELDAAAQASASAAAKSTFRSFIETDSRERTALLKTIVAALEQTNLLNPRG